MRSNKTSSTLRILLVEDNAHDRMAFGRALRKGQLSCEITECVRAEEALACVRSDDLSFDLMVVDHGLPGISGLELCKVLLDAGTALPLVILTGAGSQQLAVEALKAGVYDYIIKDPGQGYLDLLPVVLPDVVRRHGQLLAREQAEEALREAMLSWKCGLRIERPNLPAPIRNCAMRSSSAGRRKRRYRSLKKNIAL
jgi:PleD family two-component response regulator